MKVGIVGAGVSGLVCAYLLHPAHDVVLFESEDEPGGHVRTVKVKTLDGDVMVDTGFIVYNEQNYPGFTTLLDRLGVASQPSDMSFSLSCEATGVEYRGTSFNSLFAQRSNVMRPSFLAMLRDIPRFNRAARALLVDGDVSSSLADFLEVQRFSPSFVDHYLTPLGSSIWSADPSRFGAFPAASLARFLDRHGLLDLRGRPQWRTIVGGSSTYVRAIVGSLGKSVRTSTQVIRVERDASGATLHVEEGEPERFDHVIFACHADTALEVLGSEATRLERELLSTFRYQRNRATLHTDVTVMPRGRRSWASWNYRHVTDANHRNQLDRATITYHANSLQSLDVPVPLFTTLNRDHVIDPAHVIERFDFEHPVFDSPAMSSQRRHEELLGPNRTSFCGAYWGYGFHEDGLQSALRVARHFDRAL